MDNHTPSDFTPTPSSAHDAHTPQPADAHLLPPLSPMSQFATGNDEDKPMPDLLPPPPPLSSGVAPDDTAGAGCFLCLYNECDQVRLIHTFMINHAGHMPPDHMARAMASKLSEFAPETGAPPEQYGVGACLRHLRSHTLHPTVRLSFMLRSLLHLQDQLAIKLHRNEDGVDNKDVETFLKVQAQALQVYRTPYPKRLFLYDQHFHQPTASSSNNKESQSHLQKE